MSDLAGPMGPQQQRSAEADMVSRAAAPGCIVAVDPDTAVHMGAFHDDALDAGAAEGSRFDDLVGEDA
ncbi:hypothetical protein [Ferrovibrio xuzhouensis]|uniref:Uncharacterized protein n=1 Tax=Ferrovibrio xuzhouensis TaxID=1576914 RepID=A0ABV7VBS9_9PROT